MTNVAPPNSFDATHQASVVECNLANFTSAYNLEDFSKAVEVAHEKLDAHLRCQEIRGVKLERPGILLELARKFMTAKTNAGLDTDSFGEILDLYLRTGIRTNSRGYMGRQFSSVVPVSAVFDLVTAMAPQPASYYEAGQLANVADKLMAEEFGRLIGWPDGSFDMVTTSGASLANLTAVLVARNQHLKGSWSEGVDASSNRRPGIAIGEDAHFSVSRLAGMLGIGQNQLIKLPLNNKRQICTKSAAATLDAAEKKGIDVFCLVATAGTTSVGAIDPLSALADLCRKRGLWLHVDAAHGGAFLVSDQLRSRLGGIEMADSFCLDAHKMLFMPALCTLLFYRDKSVAATAFPQVASYVSDPFEEEISKFQSGMKNFECTKRPSILNLWITWSLYGRSFIEEKIDYIVSMTKKSYEYIDSLPDFDAVHYPESNIFCFMYRPVGLREEQLGRLQLLLRDSIRAGGRYFLSAVTLDDRPVLRMVIMNHEITLSDIRDLTVEIRRHAKDILARMNAPFRGSNRDEDRITERKVAS